MQEARLRGFSERLAERDDYRDEMAPLFKGFDWIAKNKNEYIL